jgi:hypothetical protein
MQSAKRDEEEPRKMTKQMTNESNDPYLWLEDVLGEQQLDWVRARNDPAVAQFAGEGTTSGAMRPTRAGYGGGPPWRATAATPPTGMY